MPMRPITSRALDLLAKVLAEQRSVRRAQRARRGRPQPDHGAQIGWPVSATW
jgi:hypothetical protein